MAPACGYDPNMLMNREMFYTLVEAQTLLGRWREEYNQIRPHSALGYLAPAT